MSEEKKCCKRCKAEKGQLSNEDLEKVTGGASQPTYIICTKNDICCFRKTVKGVANVCTCDNRSGKWCCLDLQDNCKCKYWSKTDHCCTEDKSD